MMCLGEFMRRNNLPERNPPNKSGLEALWFNLETLKFDMCMSQSWGVQHVMTYHLSPFPNILWIHCNLTFAGHQCHNVDSGSKKDHQLIEIHQWSSTKPSDFLMFLMCSNVFFVFQTVSTLRRSKRDSWVSGPMRLPAWTPWARPWRTSRARWRHPCLRHHGQTRRWTLQVYRLKPKRLNKQKMTQTKCLKKHMFKS